MKSNLGVPVILLKDNKVLMARRKNVYGAGLYGVPGGHVDDGETLVECLQRELVEEVGFRSVKHRLLGVVKEWQKTRWFMTFIYVCTEWEGEISNLEPEVSEEWRWYSLDDLPENILPGHKEGLRLLTEKDPAWLIEI